MRVVPIDGYLTCDRNGRIDLHLELPKKNERLGFWVSDAFYEISEENIPLEIPTPQWSDDLPIYVHLFIDSI